VSLAINGLGVLPLRLSFKSRYGFQRLSCSVALVFAITVAARCPALAQDANPTCARAKLEGPNRVELSPKKIADLRLRITTKNIRGGGTDDAVYFDIGPVSWKVNKKHRNDFERGDTESYRLVIPEGLDLTTADILWLRLHKKGILGVTGTRDGLDGAWHPEKVELIVDGSPHCDGIINEPLNSSCWFWKKPCRTIATNEVTSFARSLRLCRNEPLSRIAKLTGIVTTPLFKERGISGWLDCPEERQCLEGSRLKSCSGLPAMVCAIGTILIDPADSTDGLATIDLEVESVDFCNEQRLCNTRALLKISDPARPRFLRVEYRHGKNPIPKKGERVKFCGELRWDTDREGWWEIHPRNVYDVGVYSPG